MERKTQAYLRGKFLELKKRASQRGMNLICGGEDQGKPKGEGEGETKREVPLREITPGGRRPQARNAYKGKVSQKSSD